MTRRASRLAASSLAGALVAFGLPPWGWWPTSIVGVALFNALTRTTIDVGHHPHGGRPNATSAPARLDAASRDARRVIVSSASPSRATPHV
ncbi:MAG: hypothetical protein ACKOQZ_01340, partial [Actinomycetota bacterium]